MEQEASRNKKKKTKKKYIKVTKTYTLTSHVVCKSTGDPQTF
jgi:hypothetical protein